MAHVNLLPWREQRRQQQKQQYIVVLAFVAIMTGLLFWFIGQIIDTQISNQNSRNQYLQTQITALESQIAEIKRIKESKSAIEQRMALIEQLQSSRNLAPQVLDELARIVPQGVSFTSLQRTGSSIQVRGTSESNNRLAEFMRQLETSKVFTSGELSSIVADTSATDAVSEFTLTFSISEQVAMEKEQQERGGK
ncbi:MAG: PilN domain-containing protein [Pseudomonadota bacterium]|jgi:type IV pilus assembly protein PilN|uniref:Pilus assembly protein CpaD n=1 Tax=Alteromonas alba TaxID=2079529 RepID=A0A2S9V5T9_9ALTE|nr:PilN domain-containing protein [Alteromonas alba]MAD10449.1 pilus assembly protein CpaD [Alteromonas sp.]MDY6925723.1 PilN domain-containing protein [Pseudomonadota bacterium]MCP4863071.1 pilus assembly protein CpaD [Alteromonas sp.]PRO71827.1 pilus assembly protein CpaD [Alteromonas alba]HAU94139.1 pilus assembly protein CpaD [Alteromonas sp.]|tara:strand:- start:4564 stop:5145 length:582 start_codon:yes stop_codon:yes gene_type:complete